MKEFSPAQVWEKSMLGVVALGEAALVRIKPEGRLECEEAVRRVGDESEAWWGQVVQGLRG